MRSTKSSDRTLSLFSADNDARRESGSGHSSASPWAWASSAYSPWVGRPLTGGYAWSCNPQSWRRYRRQPAKVWNRWAPSSGGGAEARDHEAQGRAGANGSNHRSAKGSRGGIPRSGPIHVLVLGPGCVERRNREPTGAGGHRAASPIAANRPSCIAEG